MTFFGKSRQDERNCTLIRSGSMSSITSKCCPKSCPTPRNRSSPNVTECTIRKMEVAENTDEEGLRKWRGRISNRLYWLCEGARALHSEGFGRKSSADGGNCLHSTSTVAAVTGTETTILLITCGAACDAEPQPTVTSQSATNTAKASSFDDWVD